MPPTGESKVSGSRISSPLLSPVSHPLSVSTNYPTTPPIQPDLSRQRLKQIARWIRDELDLRVAREGPDILRPDDVLTLHETFIALRHAHNVTISDLRATGIHKAIQDISGVATRWPGRLCDDCDKIIDIWTAKFGPFSEIHPFLFGRGGRLEGIASIHEYSREALLKRWAETCPEKIHPKRSHKLGDLGFKAGQWWINPLFAHHAGIIGLEACEGGTTYDKHGAYALLLKDSGEIEASSEERFTYRVPQDDKGRFRLTSAVPKSRDPVRVLRSHSINSVWGPKAGVRFEGLYSVKGWSIKQAKQNDIAGGLWKEGDILFDVHFERNDPIPMEEVIKRPTATEVDDYAEYKRLRKLSRDGKRGKGPSIEGISPNLMDASAAIVASQVTPSHPGPLAAVRTGLQTDTQTSAPRKGMFKRLHFDDEAHVFHAAQEDVVSPKTIAEADPMNATIGKSNTLAVPLQLNRTNTHGKTDASSSESRSPTGRKSPAGSSVSSAHTAASTAPGINIREVAPWIDYDCGLTVPSPPPPDDDTVVRHERPIITQSSGTLEPDTKSLYSPGTFYSQQGARESPNLMGEKERHGRRQSGDFKGLGATLNPAVRKEPRKSIFKSRNPMGKLFDGADDANDFLGFDGPTARTTSLTVEPTTPQATQAQRVATWAGYDGAFSPDTPTLFSLARRSAINPTAVEEIASLFAEPEAEPHIDPPILVVVQQEDPFIEAPVPALPNPEETCSIFEEPEDTPVVPQPRPKASRPRAINMCNLISQSRIATPLGSPVSTPTLELPATTTEDSVAEARLRGMLGQIQALDLKTVFRDPFGSLVVGEDGSPVVKGRQGSDGGVAPEDVVGCP